MSPVNGRFSAKGCLHRRMPFDIGIVLPAFILGGVSLGRLYPGVEALKNGLVVAVTETATDEDIDALEAALKEVVR